jgi:23S rRNA-/tRNA-specific pseudouridylate synthase
LALTAGALAAEQGEWTWRIALDPRDPRKRVALDPGARGTGVKEASTRFARRAERAPFTAIDLYPHTGRTHQLRVHAAKAGCALLGDVAYGGEKRITLENGRILTAPRVMLHCAYVHLPVPSGPPLTIELAAPEDLQALWRSAGGEASELGVVPAV